MKEKITVAVCAIIYIVLVMVGWNDTSIKKSSDGREYLVFWHTYNDDEEIVLKEIIKKWENLPGNASYTVRPVRIPFEGHKEKIRTAVTVGQAPDMARVDWSFVCEMARKNAAADLSELHFDEIASKYLSGPLKSCYVDGKYYGIPDQSNCVALFYNRAILRELGIKLDPQYTRNEAEKYIPKKWEEFFVKNQNGDYLKVQAFTRYDDKRQKMTYPFAMNNTVWWNLPFFHAYGVKVISDDGKHSEIDSEAAVNCLYDMKRLVDLEVEGKGWRAGNDPERGFVNGQYAMVFMGPWNLAKFDEMEKRGQLDYGIALIPGSEKIRTASNVGGTDVVVLKPGKSKEKIEKCYDFLKFFTNGENQKYWCETLRQIPINKEANVKFESEKLNMFIDQLKYSGANPVVKDFSLMEDLINPEIEIILADDKHNSSEEEMKEFIKEVLTRTKNNLEKKILGNS